MNDTNPVLMSPKNDIAGNDLPNKVRAFKAVNLSILPSIHLSPSRVPSPRGKSVKF